MRSTARQETAKVFAEKCHELGFSTYLAKNGEYGFVTDMHGSRVLSFSASPFGGISLSGNYLPSSENGTGWRIADAVYPPRNADEVNTWLYASVPSFVKGPVQPFTTCRQYLDTYQKSSGFKRLKG